MMDIDVIGLRDIRSGHILTAVNAQTGRPTRIGEAIRSARMSAGFATQRSFAEKIDVAQSRLSDWECGRHVPSPKNLKKIAAATGHSLDDLYGVTSADTGSEEGTARGGSLGNHARVLELETQNRKLREELTFMRKLLDMVDTVSSKRARAGEAAGRTAPDQAKGRQRH